ncbi:neural proliferation differentiation and control protein 1 [Neolamprologus brichardi]|uniref:neural proliferation differentiation and control protein 1 n=1 Tax=Neolamprologus brichardi TaxID=32507 RepID=UPI0003EBC59E|nr:neural proliferation differentiation and control protein 1 [Neolamprologus brichardi]
MRARLLGHTVVFVALLALRSCLAGSPLCPRSLECALAGRHFCRPGSSHCGPCLRPLVENSSGRCVVKRRHAPHTHSVKDKASPYPELDEEIDFLSAIIREQRPESYSSAPSSQEITSKQFEEHGYTHRASSVEQPPTQSVLLTSIASPTARNHTAALSSPIILRYPPDDHVFIIMSSVVTVAGTLALLVALACWVRFQKCVHMNQKVDYPSSGLMSAQAFENLLGDKKLAHSAQMYHYQHQKQQMLSLKKHRVEPKVPDSAASTDEENEDGDFTVYECPGLAPTGEMEVKNPLFDDSTLYLQRLHK